MSLFGSTFIMTSGFVSMFWCAIVLMMRTVLLERTASWAGVSVLDNAVRVFHQEVLHNLCMILTDAGLCNWYIAKQGAEAEAALCFGILLQRTGPAMRFLYPPPPNEFGEDDKWTGLGVGHEGKSTEANATDAEVPESSELGSVTAVPDDEGLLNTLALPMTVVQLVRMGSTMATQLMTKISPCTSAALTRL
jgi:hypothetical protein